MKIMMCISKNFKEWCIAYKIIPLPSSLSSVAVYISGLVQYHDFSLVYNPDELRSEDSSK